VAMKMIQQWRYKARQLRLEIHALYFACRDPRVPWYAKIFAICILGYAFSPIDLIPDPIPVLGHLDDCVLLPIGVLVVRALMPAAVLAECRDKANRSVDKPCNWVAAGIIITIWVGVTAAAVTWAIRLTSN